MISIGITGLAAVESALSAVPERVTGALRRRAAVAGSDALESVRREIRSGIGPALHPFTVSMRGGGNKPLLDTEALLRALAVVYSSDGLTFEHVKHGRRMASEDALKEEAVGKA